MNPEKIHYAADLFEAMLTEQEPQTVIEHIAHAHRLRGWLHQIQSVTIELFEEAWLEEATYVHRKDESGAA